MLEEPDRMRISDKGKGRLIITASCIVLGLLLTSCDDSIFNVRSTQYSASEEFSYAFAVASQTHFRLAGINGIVEIVGVAGADTVKMWGQRRVESESVADAEAHLSYLQVVVSETAGEFYFRTDQPTEAEGRNYEVDYYCRVPDDMLILATNANGEISLSLLESDITCVLTNGDVAADSIRGDMDITLTNGNAILWDTLGDVGVNVTNGNVTGRVEVPASGTCHVGVTNGSVSMSFPTSTSANFTATVVNGSIVMNNLVLENINSTPTSLSGRLGSGDGEIVLHTVNGTIVVTGF